MAYCVLKETRTNPFDFGLAWIEGIDWEGPYTLLKKAGARAF